MNDPEHGFPFVWSFKQQTSLYNLDFFFFCSPWICPSLTTHVHNYIRSVSTCNGNASVLRNVPHVHHDAFLHESRVIQGVFPPLTRCSWNSPQIRHNLNQGKAFSEFDLGYVS